MTDFKQRISRNLRSARQWLTRAEEAFDKDHDVRGELDLLLAQAELQHARESNRSEQPHYKYPLLCQGAALGIAMLVAVGGLGAAFWWTQAGDKAVPIPLAGVEQDKSASAKQEASATVAPVRVAPSAAPNVTVLNQVAIQPVQHQTAASQYQQSEIKARPGDKDINLPPEEIHKLIRAAGKSLRGQ